MAAWWCLSHLLVGSAVALLGAPWLLKAPALVAIAAHAAARRPKPPQRILLRSDGHAELPDSGLMDLEVGPRSQYTTWWVRLELRGAGRAVGIVLLVDQVDRTTWRTLQAELRRARAVAVAPSSASGDDYPRKDLR